MTGWRRRGRGVLQIVADANHLGGFSLFVADGKLKHTYAFLGVFEYRQESVGVLPTGDVTVQMAFAADEAKPATPGQVTLYVNGKPAGGGRVDHTVPFGFSGYSGLFAPPLLASVVAGGAAGALIGKFARHRVESGLEEKMAAALPPGSAGIVAIYDRGNAGTSTLASAVRKSVAHVDGGGAKKLKGALADAQAGLGG